MAPTTDEIALFPDHSWVPDGIVVINDHCRFRRSEGFWVVTAGGLPLAHFAEGDKAGEAYAMVCLVDLG